MCCRRYICCLDMLKSEPSSDNESDNFYDRRGTNNPSEPIITTRDNSQTLRQKLAPSDDQFKAATSGTNVKVEVHDNVIRIIGHSNTKTASQDLKAKDSETVLGDSETVSEDEAVDYQVNGINPNDNSSCRNLFDNCNANSFLYESYGIQCGKLKDIDASNMALGVVYDKQHNAVVPKEQAIFPHSFDKYEAVNYINSSEVYHPLKICCKHDTSINSDTIVNDMCSPIKQFGAPEAEYIGPKSDIDDNVKTTELSELEIDKSAPKVLYTRDAVVTESIIEVESCPIYEQVLDEDLHTSANQDNELDYTKVDNLNIPWIDDPKAFDISLTKSDNAQKITIQSYLNKHNAPSTDSPCIVHPITSGNEKNPFIVNTPKDMVVTFPLKDISSFANRSKGTASTNPFKVDNSINDKYVTTSFVDLEAKDVVNILHNVTDPNCQCTSTCLINTNQIDNNRNEGGIVDAHLDLLPYDISTTDDVTAHSKINAMDENYIDVCELLTDISQFDNYFNEECICTQHTNAYEALEVGPESESDIKNGFDISKSCELPTDNFVAEVSGVDNSFTKTSEIATEINSLNELGNDIALSVSTTQEDTINYTTTEDLNIPWIDETIQIEFITEQSYTTLEVGICSHSDKNKELSIHCNENFELINPCPDTFFNVVDAEQHTTENILLKGIPMLLENPCSHEQSTHAGLIDMNETADYLTENEITTGFPNMTVKNVKNLFNETVGCSTLNPTIANKHDMTTKLIDVYGINNYLNKSSKYHILKSTESDMIDFSSPVKSKNAHETHKVTCVVPVSEAIKNSDSAEFCELITDNLVTEVTASCIKESLNHIEFTAEEELHLPTSTIPKDAIKNVEINNLKKLSIDDIEPLNSSALEMYIPQEDAIHRQSKKTENFDKELSFSNRPLRTDSTVVNTQQPVITNYPLKDVCIENEINLVDAENATDIKAIPYIE